ncbi:hypothetical protein PIB30_008588 [Stylosanthes scabra]|uniref:Peroxisomal membrane protein 11A n=1 Tax=Stylosanthes scabra TaxID=79078 RepID=A0ABU6R4X4_9FABA|nr:hypothetical protein [Stylosanthes scabra]
MSSKSPPQPPSPPHPNQNTNLLPKATPEPKLKPPQQEKKRDFLTHLESYLSKRDGVDKLLKISRYTAKLILATSWAHQAQSQAHNGPSLYNRLKTFESSVGISRKSLRLGKFVQDINALRALPKPRVKSTSSISDLDFVLSVVAYGGEGVYFFVEQLVWLAKSGLIDPKRSRSFQKISAWCEFVGYFGSVALKFRDLKVIGEDEECLKSSVEISSLRGECCEVEEERLKKVREKKMMKKLSILQDLADAVMALDDMIDGKGPFSGPVFMASAGLLSALISTHKNWKAC